MPNALLRQIETTTLCYDDFEVGDEWQSSARTVSEADVVNFAGLSADYNSLHVDAEYAAATAFGQRIAHGLLVLAIASGLCSRLAVMKLLEKSILGLAGLQVRWRKPTFLGDTLHVVMRIAAKEPGNKSDRGSLILDRRVINQRGEVVMESDWRLVVRRRDGASP
jgi:acyl dehydratase